MRLAYLQNLFIEKRSLHFTVVVADNAFAADQRRCAASQRVVDRQPLIADNAYTVTFR